MHTSGYIASGGQRLHYLKWAGGPHLLVCFHGYGNQASLFASLARALQPAYTTVSFDLPYHGDSAWTGEAPWQKTELADMVKALMAEQDTDKLSLACFSIGGRICLTLAELMPEAIEQLVLIAADGLVPNAFYRFVTTNQAGKKIFQHFLDNSDRYKALITWLGNRGLIAPARIKFVDRYAGQPAAREFLKKVWPNLRLMVPDLPVVKANIDRYRIPTQLFMGRYDTVIPPDHAAAFAGKRPVVKIHILEKPHRVIDDESVPFIAQQFKFA